MTYQPSKASITLNLRNQLGHELQVQIQPDELPDALAYYASKGFVSGNYPPGGMELPLVMFPVVNFSAIGIQGPWTLERDDGPKLGVKYLESMFYHRFGAENRKKKMQTAVWFSRGARQSDPSQYREVSGEIEYVRLITFKGTGRITNALRQWCLPGTVDEKGQILKTVHTLPGKEGQELTQAIEEAISSQQAFAKHYQSQRNAKTSA